MRFNFSNKHFHVKKIYPVALQKRWRDDDNKHGPFALYVPVCVLCASLTSPFQQGFASPLQRMFSDLRAVLSLVLLTIVLWKVVAGSQLLIIMLFQLLLASTIYCLKNAYRKTKWVKKRKLKFVPQWWQSPSDVTATRDHPNRRQLSTIACLWTDIGNTN